MPQPLVDHDLDPLRKRVRTLETENEALKARVAALEAAMDTVFTWQREQDARLDALGPRTLGVAA